MFTVYALYSPKSIKHYYGYTSDMEARLLSHNFLGKDWTAKYRPLGDNLYKSIWDKAGSDSS